jgi:ArsR family transcriptional regulator
MQLKEFFKIVGDENRLKILALIGKGEKSVGDLVNAMRLEQSLVSHHLGKMKRAGVLKSRVAGQMRFYSVSNPVILELVEKAGEIAKDIVKPEKKKK